MSGICTAAPAHLDAYDKNSMYSSLYWSELDLNRRHARIYDFFVAILHMIIHDDRITQNLNIARQNNTLSIFFETPQNFTNPIFREAHVLLREA